MLQWDTIAAELTTAVNWYVKQVTAGFSSVREALSVLMLNVRLVAIVVHFLIK